MIPAAPPAAVTGASSEECAVEDDGKRARTVPAAPPEETVAGAPKVSCVSCVRCGRLQTTLFPQLPCADCQWFSDVKRYEVWGWPPLLMGTNLFDAALYLID